MFPSLVLKNQFGEESNNAIIGGSSQIQCSFVVDHANGNGLGIRSLKGQGVAKVFMHTTATPAVGSPNPAVGYIVVQLSSAYAAYAGGTAGFVAPISGTPINVTSGLTVGQAYIITSVGTTTAAQFQSLGLPTGIVPAPGVSFIATSASAGVGTGVVEVPMATGSGIDHIEIVGDPNLTSGPSQGGAQIICLALGGAPLAATAPADGTVIGLTFNMIPVASEQI